MRVLETIPHESITIQIFKMNEKFIVKFEAGPMEQAFKFDNDQVKSIEKLKEIINSEFIENVRKRFNEMFLQLQNSTQTLS